MRMLGLMVMALLVLAACQSNGYKTQWTEPAGNEGTNSP